MLNGAFTLVVYGTSCFSVLSTSEFCGSLLSSVISVSGSLLFSTSSVLLSLFSDVPSEGKFSISSFTSKLFETGLLSGA